MRAPRETRDAVLAHSGVWRCRCLRPVFQCHSTLHSCASPIWMSTHSTQGLVQVQLLIQRRLKRARDARAASSRAPRPAARIYTTFLHLLKRGLCHYPPRAGHSHVSFFS